MFAWKISLFSKINISFSVKKEKATRTSNHFPEIYGGRLSPAKIMEISFNINKWHLGREKMTYYDVIFLEQLFLSNLERKITFYAARWIVSYSWRKSNLHETVFLLVGPLQRFLSGIQSYPKLSPDIFRTDRYYKH